jgi:hypothetical protein
MIAEGAAEAAVLISNWTVKLVFYLIHDRSVDAQRSDSADADQLTSQ